MLTWEIYRGSPDNPEIKMTSPHPGTNLILSRNGPWGDWSLTVEIKAKNRTVSHNIELTNADGPDTWAYMEEVSKGAAVIYLESLQIWLEEMQKLTNAAIDALPELH